MEQKPGWTAVGQSDPGSCFFLSFYNGAGRIRLKKDQRRRVMGQFLTPQEVADLLKIKKNTVY